jgi:hypothetical protein
VVLTAVHDVLEPVLDLERNLAAVVLLAHGEVDVLAAVVDLGDGADEVLRNQLMCVISKFDTKPCAFVSRMERSEEE